MAIGPSKPRLPRRHLAKTYFAKQEMVRSVRVSRQDKARIERFVEIAVGESLGDLIFEAIEKALDPLRSREHAPNSTNS